MAEQAVGVWEAAGVVVRTRDDCRMCGSESLVKIWSFGETPLANSYVYPSKASQTEPKAPLNVYYCQDCHLVQLRDVVDPDIMFTNYLYVSSTSPTFVKHFEDYAHHLIDRFKLDEKSLVVDVGSNDGILLKPLQEKGVQVLGIDPAENVAAIANEKGIETLAEYFTPEMAVGIAQERSKATVIAANNVFAHTDDVDIFVEAVKQLLLPEGAFVFEVQYLGDLMAKNLFDIVYHEHVCYYSVHPLIKFFAKHDMEVFDVERPTVHGGSLRVFVQFRNGPHDRSKNLDRILEEEERQGLTGVEAYDKFAERIADNKKKLLAMLQDIKKEGKRIVGYGAPAKATTLCYTFGIDGKVLDYIVDDAEMKQGLLMPGTHIPIVGPGALYGGKPDYCLILAWNFAGPIMENHKRFAERGGRFIIPVPEPKIV
ncbi:MAG: class I SAM-dependent methyltransferase [bacterium]